MREISLFAATIMLALALALPAGSAQAADYERYQAILVQSGDVDVAHPQVLIVDTEEGHLWLWERQGQHPEDGGMRFESHLSYQGQVGPEGKTQSPPESAKE